MSQGAVKPKSTNRLLKWTFRNCFNKVIVRPTFSEKRVKLSVVWNIWSGYLNKERQTVWKKKNYCNAIIFFSANWLIHYLYFLSSSNIKSHKKIWGIHKILACNFYHYVWPWSNKLEILCFHSLHKLMTLVSRKFIKAYRIGILCNGQTDRMTENTATSVATILNMTQHKRHMFISKCSDCLRINANKTLFQPWLSSCFNRPFTIQHHM